MKTLVIHPEDSSTWFLNRVYENIENLTLVTGNVSKEEVKSMIRDHDRIMMMGHGSPGGLFSVGNFPSVSNNGYIIDESFVELLSTKKDSVYIWCNADQFVDRFDLKGFYTGMFISEVGEAYYCGLPGTKQPEVDESNFKFVDLMGEHINNETIKIHEKVKEEYGLLVEHNPVANYNHQRLYINS
tara:strand:- start:552 stop:1106 length:555 start_codon:yes stop_codon:yes gene_type:complete